MHIVFKVVFPILVAYLMIIGFYRLYRLLNEKITGSHTLTQVLFYALVLFISCLALFVGGSFIMFETYLLLAG